jgi:hypothetical protein
LHFESVEVSFFPLWFKYRWNYGDALKIIMFVAVTRRNV